MTRCYERPFLKNVVVRADFAQQLNELTEELPQTLYEVCLSLFPIPEPRVSNRELFKVSVSEGSQPAFETQRQKVSEFLFHDTLREKTLRIAHDGVWITYSKYRKFEDLKNDIHIILTAVVAVRSDVAFQRIGLRYINEIRLDNTSSPLNWKGYISSNLLSIFKVYPDLSVIARAFQVLELNFGEMHLTFQYGMHNPDYPAAIRQRVFILDLDGSYSGYVHNIEVMDLLDKFHGRIESVFESAITDKLRVIMIERS